MAVDLSVTPVPVPGIDPGIIKLNFDSRFEDKIHPNIAVGLSMSPDHDGLIIAASPLIKQPGTLPYRVVLVAHRQQFVVWDQLFMDFPGYNSETNRIGNVPTSSKWTYHHGDYFMASDFPAALQKFADRVAKLAKHTESIMR